MVRIGIKNFGRTANPALTAKTFQGLPQVAAGQAMTIQGTVNKAGILLMLILLGAVWTWYLFYQTMDPEAVYPLLSGGGAAGLIFGYVTIFRQRWAAFTAPLYCLAEGLVIGGLSSLLESVYPGLVVQAVGLTFGTLFGLLLAYKSRLIKATQNFKLGVAAATIGIVLFYLITLILGRLGVRVQFIHESGFVGILISLIVIVVAALNLVLDFDFIETGAQEGAPKYMEWYGAFGLMVTLIWLYLEILNLLSKLRIRD